MFFLKLAVQTENISKNVLVTVQQNINKGVLINVCKNQIIREEVH